MAQKWFLGLGQDLTETAKFNMSWFQTLLSSVLVSCQCQLCWLLPWHCCSPSPSFLISSNFSSALLRFGPEPVWSSTWCYLLSQQLSQGCIFVCPNAVLDSPGMMDSKGTGLVPVSKAGEGWVYILSEKKRNRVLRVVSAPAHRDLELVQLSQGHFGVSLEAVNTFHPYFHAFLCGSISVLHHRTRSILMCSFSKFVVAAQVNLFLLWVVMAFLCRDCLYKGSLRPHCSWGCKH